jgi:hypothetical protein
LSLSLLIFGSLIIFLGVNKFYTPVLGASRFSAGVRNIHIADIEAVQKISKLSEVLLQDVDVDLNSADCEEMCAVLGLIKGDVNLDKVVDETDLELFKDYLTGNVTFNDTQKYCGDIDCSSTYLWGFAADGSDLKELEKMLAA